MGFFRLCSCVIRDVDYFFQVYFSVSTVKGGGLVFVPVFSGNLTIFQCLQLSGDCFVYVPVLSRMLTIFQCLQLSGIVLFMFLFYPGY